MIDLDVLERLAKAATPGPWTRTTGPYVTVHGDNRDPDAHYIAAASPDVVLALIARARVLESYGERYHVADCATGGHARAKLIAAAPDLVRALLDVEWIDSAKGEACDSCGHWRISGHAPDCLLDAALRKAGVRP